MVMIETDEKKSSIVFLSISLALFLAFSGFFIWHTVRMRDYELNYIKIDGTFVGAEMHHSSSGNGGSSSAYYLVIEYSFEGNEYKFTDRVGHRYIKRGVIGSTTEIYVDPQNPEMAEKVSSAPFVSIICACFLAFFCVTYAAGMNILLGIKGSTFKKRFAFVWGAEIVFCFSVILLFWLGLPHSSFGEIFIRINGAIGACVISGLVALIAIIDGIVTHVLHSKYHY